MEEEKIIKNSVSIRAAIYTRKSSEEGLDLDFNSLDAQKEACEAYIRSQKHEGWTLVEKEYSDGGISGGTLERPALKELLRDIKDGRVNMIVVYKIDRLTRSLHDFSKLVDIFDVHKTSFVSITQQFNTSTSMGRLTLNMLLSFAQFERELTGERIRDKKLATAKKGMWSGGSSPFGYKILEKKLIPNEEEVPKLRRIFELYIQLKSAIELKYRLIEEKIFTQTGKVFTTGNLYELLKRKVYLGKVVHKGIAYDGLHEAILDKKIFDKVQEILKENNKSNKKKIHAKEPSLLSGKIYDDKDNVMSPSHAIKRGNVAQGIAGKRYRYYVSQAIMSHMREKQGSLGQIPAPEIEETTSKIIQNKLQNLLKLEKYRIEEYQIYEKNLEEYLKSWNLESREIAYLIRQILVKVVISTDEITYYINTEALEDIFDLIVTKEDLGDYAVKEIHLIECEIVVISYSLKRVNQGKKMILGDGQISKNNSLIELLRKSWSWNDRILNGESSIDIQKETGFTKSYVNDVLAMRFLSINIQLKIMRGEQPVSWTVHKFRKCKMSDWREQEKILE